MSLAALARHRHVLLASVVTILVIALTYIWLRPPSFTASGRLVVDNRVLQMSAPNAVFTTSASATGWAGPHVLSQVEILRSRRVAAAALTRLERQGTPWTPEQGTTDRMKAWLGWPDIGATDEDRTEAFRRQFRVTRVGETFAIDIRAASSDPSAAPRLVNALMASYLGEIAAANSEASRAATAWLRDAAREAGSTARIISEAVAPEHRDGPSAPYVLVVAFIGGLMVGTGAALTAALVDRKIRSPDALKAAVDGDVLGCIPKYRAAVSPDCPPADFQAVIETLRVVLTLEGTDVRCVGISAPRTGAGVTTVSRALALTTTHAGLRTLLVEAGSDVAEVDFQTPDGLVVRKVATAALTDRAPAALFKPETADAYDFVVVDLPPLAPPAAVRAAARFIDGFVIVVAAGEIDADTLCQRLEAAGPVRHRVLGFVLNEAGPPSRRPGRTARGTAVSQFRTLLSLIAFLCTVIGAPTYAVGDDYLLDSGDRVRVRVQEWPDVTGEFLVGADGSISVPGVGPVRARGSSPNTLAQAISDKLRERAHSTNSITVVDVIRYWSIYVLGDVQRPGEYEFQPHLTVTRAISLAGGFYRPPVAGFQRFERDALLSRGEAATFSARADRLRIRLARLQAELKNSDDIELPAVLARRQDKDAIADMLAEARMTLTARRDSIRKQTDGFAHAKMLLEQEIASLNRQIEAETRQLDYVRRELDKMRNLAERGLASSPRMLDLERNTAQITGARQALETSIVRSRAEMHKLDQRIAEIKNDIADKVREEIEKVSLELVEATGKVQTSLMLANEAETLGPEALMRQETEDPQHRFVIVRRAPDGVQKEFTTHRHGNLEPGDVVEIVKVLRDPTRKDSTAAVR